MKKVLIACEESQVTTIAMREIGIEAFSCDIIPCSGGHPEWHIQDDVLNHLKDGWDLMIAHPPCTYLSNAGIGWFNEKKYGEKAQLRKIKRVEAFNFVMALANANIPRIVIENPVGYLNSHWRKPDQIIQPWQFGDANSKRTCLWLKNLPLLKATSIVKPRIYSYFKSGPKKGKPRYFVDSLPPSKNRAAIRSKTFLGIGRAFAEQYGKLI